MEAKKPAQQPNQVEVPEELAKDDLKGIGGYQVRADVRGGINPGQQPSSGRKQHYVG